MLNHLSVSLTRLGRGDRQRFSTSHPSKFKVSTRNERKNFLFSLSLSLSLASFLPATGSHWADSDFTEFYRVFPGFTRPTWNICTFLCVLFFQFLTRLSVFSHFISTSIDHSRPILSFMVESCFGRVHL